MQSRNIIYRADIDGLRGLAILFVVLFHFLPGLLPGGAIGVDIFFVISGDLITGKIIRGRELGEFDFLNFYFRRAKRIFPALILVLIFCQVVAFGFLLLPEYLDLNNHIFAGGLFYSNFQLVKETGYFDRPAEFKPLLHLWSLAIEEQFYLIWPFVLIFFIDLMPLLTSTLILCVASFLANIWLIHGSPNEVFYLLPFRLWELLVGAALVIYERRKNKNFVNSNSDYIKEFSSFVGAGLIVAGLIFIDQDKLFPGYWALLPTLGAALIIAADSKSLFNKWILSSRPILFTYGIGPCSFSLDYSLVKPSQSTNLFCGLLFL